MAVRTFSFVSFVAAAMASASPATAAVVLCTGNNCTPTDENVLVEAQITTTLGTAVTGLTNSTEVEVEFTSGTDILIGSANGQADISSADNLLNSLTFSLASGFGFTGATFNLFPLPGQEMNEATSVVISYTTTTGTGSQTLTIDDNGQNFTGIFGNAGELFTSVTFTGDPGTSGIQDLRQLRLTGVQALAVVPEPSTWALLILGFGIIGGTMRRGNAAVAKTSVRSA